VTNYHQLEHGSRQATRAQCPRMEQVQPVLERVANWHLL
jgi:hypothetical protein